MSLNREVAKRCALTGCVSTPEILKNGGTVNLPVMASLVIRDGKIAVWREYWDPATLTKQLLEGESGEAVTKRCESCQAEAGNRGATIEPID
jgi:hypothetical protein